MEKIFKKSLALMVSAAVSLTAFVGCLTANANPEGATEVDTLATYSVVSINDAEPGSEVGVIINGTDLNDVCAHDVYFDFPNTFTIGAVYDMNDLDAENNPAQLTAYNSETPNANFDYKIETVDNLISVRFLNIINFACENDSVETSALQLKIMVTVPETPDIYNVTITGDFANQTEEWLNTNRVDGTVTVVCPHKYGEYVTTDPDEHWQVCTICGEESAHEAHAWDDGEVTQEPTATEPGIKTYTCSVCGGTKTEDIPATGVTNPVTVDLYLSGVLSKSVDYDSVAEALDAAANFANEKVGSAYYDPIVKLNKDIELTEDIDVGAYVTFVLGDYTITTGDYSFNLTSSGIVKANYQIADFASNVFVNEAVSDSVYTYTNKLQLTFTAASLTLSNQIFINYTAEKSGTISGDLEYGLIYKKSSDLSTEYSADSSSIKVTSSAITAQSGGIPAKEMNDELVARFYAKTVVGGKDYYVYSNKLSYSIVQYASSVLSKTSSAESLVNLMKAMLNYGAQAQIHFSYDTDNLANSILDEADRVISSDTSYMLSAKEAPDLSYNSTGYVSSASLVLLDAVNMKFYTKDTLSDANYKLLVWNDKEYQDLLTKVTDEITIADLMTESNCSNVLDLDSVSGAFTLQGIAAKKFADTYYVRLVEETTAGTYYDIAISYSVTQYCVSASTSGSLTSDFANSIAIYSQAARLFFNNYVIDSCVD